MNIRSIFFERSSLAYLEGALNWYSQEKPVDMQSSGRPATLSRAGTAD
jgi:hypothetical protein